MLTSLLGDIDTSRESSLRRVPFAWPLLQGLLQSNLIVSPNVVNCRFNLCGRSDFDLQLHRSVFCFLQQHSIDYFLLLPRNAHFPFSHRICQEQLRSFRLVKPQVEPLDALRRLCKLCALRLDISPLIFHLRILKRTGRSPASFQLAMYFPFRKVLWSSVLWHSTPASNSVIIFPQLALILSGMHVPRCANIQRS